LGPKGDRDLAELASMLIAGADTSLLVGAMVVRAPWAGPTASVIVPVRLA